MSYEPRVAEIEVDAVSSNGVLCSYYFRLAGVKNPLAIGQAAFAIQLVGNICSWPLVDRIGRRPIIVGGCIVMTCGLLLIGGLGTLHSQPALSAVVAFMTLWGFLYQMTLGAVAYAVGGETPSPTLRQKTYSINIMVATAASCLVLQVMPYLINTDQLNLGAKICFSTSTCPEKYYFTYI